MRLPLPCVECVQSKADPKTGLVSVEMLFVAIEDEQRFSVKCSAGHESVLVLDNPPHELLFESGGMAFLDGYYREAVASFAASLERFHEHALRATLLQSRVPAETVESAWKHLANRSERQFGAFLSLHISAHKVLPSLPSDKWVQFRNDVVHKGVFPPASKTGEYGSEIMRVVAEAAQLLEKTAAHGLIALHGERQGRARAKGAYAGSIRTILSDAQGQWPKVKPFDEQLRDLDDRRHGRGMGTLTA